MWYSSNMPDFNEELTEARAAVAHAQDVREAHRKRSKRGSHSREQAILGALERLRDAMRPLRHYQGQVAYTHRKLVEEQYEALREVSAAMQAERRKLWKMAAH